MKTFNVGYMCDSWIAYEEKDCDSAEDIIRMLRDKRRLVVHKDNEAEFRKALAKVKKKMSITLELEVVDDGDDEQ